jgi:predicted dinucleotide-binding enzyme
MRDGRIEGLDSGLSDSEWVARRLGRPVVKLFNSISVNSLKSKGRTAGEPGRVALPVSGDDPDAKRTAFRLADEAGFDAIDAGPLSQSWRQQPGTGAYTTDLDAHHLRLALDRLDDGDRKQLPERRDSNLKMILALPDGPGSDQSVRALRRQWDLPEDI